jgi:hypothetical protein
LPGDLTDRTKKEKIEKYTKRLERIDIEKYIYEQTWRSDFPATSMIGSIGSWKEKYNLDVIFCDKKDTAKVILESFKLFIARYDMDISHLTQELP